MGLWNPHENPKCLGPFMLPLGVPSHAQVSLFKSFLCESFRSLITQLSFLFKKELHFHPHLETVTESCKSSTKIFPTLARVNTSTHMHVCVDKKKLLSVLPWIQRDDQKSLLSKTLFISSLSAETMKPYLQVDRDLFFQKLHISNIICENYLSLLKMQDLSWLKSVKWNLSL